MCTKKHNSLKVENIENANNTYIKQTKNDCTSKCQQILPQWSSVDSMRKVSRFKFKNCKPSHQTTLKSFVFLR
jgi:hypothetical protein